MSFMPRSTPEASEAAPGPQETRAPPPDGQDTLPPVMSVAQARRARAIHALALVALAHVAGTAGAEPDPMRGAALYAQHCAMCHGAEARGDGPLASSLLVQPTNLRSLGRGAAFPTFRVAARIDGRDPLVAHGSPMPIWGQFFEGPQTALRAASGQPILTSAPVADLVAYLATIQD